MKQEVLYLLEIIKYILNKTKGELMVPAKDMDWGQLIQLAIAHSILNFVCYGVATYIISNGTFGTQKNSVAVSVAKNGRVRFLWETIFPNLKTCSLCLCG